MRYATIHMVKDMLLCLWMELKIFIIIVENNEILLYACVIIMPFNGINPRSIVVMDNAAIRHVAAVEKTLNGVGVIVRYLPS